jgi:hypothetical protein
VAFQVSDATYLGIVREVVDSSQIVGLDDRSILFEQPLVITHVVRENFVEVANDWQAGRAAWLSDGIAIDCNGYGRLAGQDLFDRA